MVENTLRMVDPNIPFTAVRASRGEVTRAEPVSARKCLGADRHSRSVPIADIRRTSTNHRVQTSQSSSLNDSSCPLAAIKGATEQRQGRVKPDIFGRDRGEAEPPPLRLHAGRSRAGLTTLNATTGWSGLSGQARLFERRRPLDRDSDALAEAIASAAVRQRRSRGAFAWKEEHTLSQALTLQYDQASKRSESLSSITQMAGFQSATEGVELAYRTFDKDSPG